MQYLRDMLASTEAHLATAHEAAGEARPEFRDFVRLGDRAAGVQALLPSDLLTRLVEAVRRDLHDFIDPATGRIGHAFPITESPTVIKEGTDGALLLEAATETESFAHALAIAVAILGANTVADLISEWRQGVPFRHRVKAVLNSDLIAIEPIALDGVQLESLPISTDLLDAVPTSERGLPDFLGRIMLTVDRAVAPALFRPGAATSAHEGTPSLGAVCQALALDADIFAEVAFAWLDYGEQMSAFGLGPGQVAFGWSPDDNEIRARQNSDEYRLHTDHLTGVTSLTPTGAREVHVDIERLGAIVAALVDADSAIQVAVPRWVKSKRTAAPLADRLIDLRIAMEALYSRDFRGLLAGGGHEVAFRVALFGAWHLGATIAERRAHRATLHDAYRAASRAVHGRPLKASDAATLSAGQSLVRRGLLAIATDGPPADWGDLVLGVPDASHDAPRTAF